MAATPFSQKSSADLRASSALQLLQYSHTKILGDLHSRARVVCRIVLGQGSATGFLIGKNLVMTNHHVLPNEATARKAQAIFFYTQGNAQAVQVDFDPDCFFCTSKTPDSLGFEPLKIHQLDFTIIAIKPHPKITEISHLVFSIFDTPKPQTDTHANIIHHPLEQDGTSYQRVSFRNNLVKEVTQFTLHYTTTTMPGSSGAPVMDDEGNLIALHRATCTHLLKALLEEKVLTALLNDLFPGVKFAKEIVHKDGKEHEGKCATVEGSTLFIFTKGDWKGLYWHNDKMQSPASLFGLIKTKHDPAKLWALRFLRIQGYLVPYFHSECNTSTTMTAICTYLHKHEHQKFDKIKIQYDASQKTPTSILKESYLQQLSFLSLFLSNEPFPIESFFTQLSIVSSASQENKEKEARDPHLIEKDSLREIHTRLCSSETPIEMKTLFDERDKTPVKRVLILGRAGIGKSTLCQKIAYDWAKGELFKGKFESIFHLKLRELNAWIQHPQNQLKGVDDPDVWLSHIIAFLCYAGVYQETILQQLRTKSDKILVMFDGWDEAVPELTQALKLCFQKSQVEHFLLTSRPGVTEGIQGNFQLVVENMGFSPDQIKVYAEKFFTHMKNPDLPIFLQHLHERSDLLTIAHVPIQLQILCALWHKGEKEFPKTLTEMFAKIVDHLFTWEESKRSDKMPISKKRLLYRALGELALKGLDQRQLIFSKGMVEDVLANQDFDTLRPADFIGTGLIKGCGQDGEMYFIHLTYQEYCIAQQISLLSEKEQSDFVQRYRYQPQFHLVIRMLAGSLWGKSHKNIQSLEVFFEWLYAEPVDMIGSYQTELVLACLEECQNTQLEEVIWKKYKIADFIERVFSNENMRDCLNRCMRNSRKAFFQVLKKLQEVDNATDVKWFLGNLQHFLKADCLSDDFFAFIKRCLSHSNDLICDAVVNALAKPTFPAEKKHLPTLLGWLQAALDDQYFHCDDEDVIVALGILASRAEEKYPLDLVDWFEAMLANQDFGIRRAAVEAIVNLAPHAGGKNLPTLLGWLQTALTDQNAVVRRDAIKAIVNLAPHAGEKNLLTLLGWLQTALTDQNSYVRRDAVNALVELAPHAGEKNFLIFLNWLQTTLTDEKNHVIYAAVIKAIMTLAPHAREKHFFLLLYWVQTALADQDYDVRCGAIHAIKMLALHAGEKHFPTLLGWLQIGFVDQHVMVRFFAVQVLESIASHAGEKHFPSLLEWFQNKNDEVRSCLVNAIVNLAPHAGEKHFPTLLGWLQTAFQYFNQRRAVILVLGKLAPHAGEKHFPTLLGWLQTALTDQDSNVYCPAGNALTKFVPYAPEFGRISLADAREISPNFSYAGEKCLTVLLNCIQIHKWPRDTVKKLKRQSLVLILSSAVLIHHPATKMYIIPHMIDQGIPLRLVEKNKNMYLLQLGEYIQEITLEQKELIVQMF